MSECLGLGFRLGHKSMLIGVVYRNFNVEEVSKSLCVCLRITLKMLFGFYDSQYPCGAMFL